MNDERLDALLDSSRTAPHAIDRTDIRSMMREAEKLGRSARSRRRGKVGVAAGAVLALVIGGGGVAVASGLVTWPSGFEDPDAAFGFTLPSGRQCEFRMVVASSDDEGADGSASADQELVREIEADVAEWLGDGDLLVRLDLVSARAEAELILVEQQSIGMTVAIGADGWLVDTAADSEVIDPDSREALAIDRAVRKAMTEQLTADGHAENTWTFSTDGGVKCAAE